MSNIIIIEYRPLLRDYCQRERGRESVPTCHVRVEVDVSREEKREERCWRYSTCIERWRDSCSATTCPLTQCKSIHFRTQLHTVII